MSKETGEESKEQSSKVSPIEIERYLKGIDYPASKQKLIDCAQKNSATPEIIEMLNQFEEREYSSPAEVSQEVGTLE